VITDKTDKYSVENSIRYHSFDSSIY